MRLNFLPRFQIAYLRGPGALASSLSLSLARSLAKHLYPDVLGYRAQV